MKLSKRLREKWVTWRQERERKYWAMSFEKAQSVSFAIFYQIGAVAAEHFMDEWKRRNGLESGPPILRGNP